VKQPLALLVCCLALAVACSKEDESASGKPPANPRLAKSGQQLAEETDIPIANNTSETVPVVGQPKPKPRPKPANPNGGSTSKPTALSPAQIKALTARASKGDAAAQLELGNAYFEGNGVKKDKSAAEYWWRKAAAQANGIAAGNLAMLNTDPEEGVSFFGTEVDGKRIVYLVDSSGSMRVGQRFQEEKDELIRSIRTLKRDMLFTVIFYDDKPHFPQPLKLLPATAKNIEAISKWITAHPLGGNNFVLPALRNAVTLKPDTIFLLSDGMTDFNPDVVCREVRKINAEAKARIHTISLHDAYGRKMMQQIADENNGKFRYVAPGSFNRR